ncbi:MAG: 30S ribosomal protein S16 [Candidatus Methylacidiphilales bacterium]
MVVLRLRRQGSKGRPFYQVVVADKRSPRDGKFIEELGTYDPLEKNQVKALKLDRVDHWISVGAQPTDRVKSLIRSARVTSK